MSFPCDTNCFKASRLHHYSMSVWDKKALQRAISKFIVFASMHQKVSFLFIDYRVLSASCNECQVTFSSSSPFNHSSRHDRNLLEWNSFKLRINSAITCTEWNSSEWMKKFRDCSKITDREWRETGETADNLIDCFTVSYLSFQNLRKQWPMNFSACIRGGFTFY